MTSNFNGNIFLRNENRSRKFYILPYIKCNVNRVLCTRTCITTSYITHTQFFGTWKSTMWYFYDGFTFRRRMTVCLNNVSFMRARFMTHVTCNLEKGRILAVVGDRNARLCKKYCFSLECAAIQKIHFRCSTDTHTARFWRTNFMTGCNVSKVCITISVEFLSERNRKFTRDSYPDFVCSLQNVIHLSIIADIKISTRKIVQLAISNILSIAFKYTSLM